MENKEFEKRINKIFETYNNIIAPFIVQLEANDSEFPVAILNEIRAIMGHLSKVNISSNEKIQEDNIIKAERHIKRSILDCYKYMCISYIDEYYKFDRLYKHVDLSEINNGDFLTQMCTLEASAKKSFKEAKLTELSTTAIEDDVFKAYEEAYNQYADLIYFIESNEHYANKAKHKFWKHVIIDLILGACTIAGVLLPLIQYIVNLII